jgi:hypothetical protein
MIRQNNDLQASTMYELGLSCGDRESKINWLKQAAYQGYPPAMHA